MSAVKEILNALRQLFAIILAVVFCVFLLQAGAAFAVYGGQALFLREFIGMPNLGLSPATGADAIRLGKWLFPIGIISFATGVYSVVWGWRLFCKNGQDPKPTA